MRILSIDPSLSNTAIVALDTDGKTVKPVGYILSQTKPQKKGTPVMPHRFERCKQHFENIDLAIRMYKPDVVFFEYPTGSQSSAAAVGVGVSLSICAYVSSMLPTHGFKASQVKKKVNGTNSASKKEVISYVNNRYPNFLPTKNKKGDINEGKAEHIADAIVIAEVGIEEIKINQ